MQAALTALLALLLALLFLRRRQLKKSPNYYLSHLSRLANPAQPEYDVIIVGGGTSGCVLASRLSEDPRIRVLLLEAGQSGSALPYSRIPSLFPRLFRSGHLLNLRTEPQPFAKGRSQYWPRAKLLGGCSSINAQMAQYGSPEDFDQWASFVGDSSWSWKNLSRYFKKFESYQPHPDFPLVNSLLRGSDGPVHVGYFSTVTESSKAFIRACVNIGIPLTHDFNAPPGILGVNRVMTYVDRNLKRVSSESAYLTDDVLSRKNLTVAVGAHVTRVLFDNKNGDTRAMGVEFGNSPTEARYRVFARKEVIISAGAVQSPQVLMLSGIGPASHLQKHGISVVHELPGVGAHLVDHPVVDIYFKDKSGISLRYLKPESLQDWAKFWGALFQYFVAGTGGPLATNWGEAAAFVRSDDPVLFPEREYPKKLPDSTSGMGSPDLELFTTPVAYKNHGLYAFDVDSYCLHVYLLRPSSTGSIKLNSSNPWDHPVINPNYLKESEDAEKLLRGVRLLLKIAHTQPMAQRLDHSCSRKDMDHNLHLKSDAELLEIVRERVDTVYHPASTCRMAPADKDGVVDSQLRVHGIRGLRVCDASIFPWIVSGHTAGACFAIAEKLADEMKQSWNSP